VVELVTDVGIIELVGLVVLCVIEVVPGMEVEVVGNGVEIANAENVVEIVDVVRGRVVVSIGMEVEIEIGLVDRTEVVGTGMKVVTDDDDPRIEIDVVIGTEVLVGTGMEVVTEDDPGIEIDVVIGTEVLVGTGMEVVDPRIEVIGTEVLVDTGTEVVVINIVEDCEIEAEIVDTGMELISITEGEEITIELVGCGKEVEVVLMDMMELSTAEEVTTSEDGDTTTKLELVSVVVVVGNGVGGVPQN